MSGARQGPGTTCVLAVAVALAVAVTAVPVAAALTTTTSELVHPQSQAHSEFGLAVAALGDVDGDDVADVAVGAPKHQSPQPGEVVVHSGATSAVLHRIADPVGVGDYHFGYAVAPLGDVDGDQVGDMAVGAPGTNGFLPLPCPPPEPDCGRTPDYGRAFVFSGSTGDLLFPLVPDDPEFLALGRSVTSLGDVTGDGVPDVAVGAPLLVESGGLSGKRGIVYAFSGADGSQLWKAQEPQAEDIPSFGWALAALPDVTGDARPDLLVGAPFTSTGDGAAHVLSGTTGALVRSLQSPSPGTPDALFGWSVTGTADTTGDGLPDLAVGQLRPGLAHVFTAATGAHVRTISSPAASTTSFFGTALAAAGDVDGDGRSDLFVGAPGTAAVHVVPGDPAQALTTVHDPDPSDGTPGLRGFGSSVAAATSLGGDPGADMVIGDPGAEKSGGASAGRAYTVVLRVNTPPVADAGADVTAECEQVGGATVQLDGSGSSDPDGDPLSHTWTDADGSTVGTAATVEVTVPLGTTTYTLTVADGVAGTSTDTVQITVEDTVPPVASGTLSPAVLWPPNHTLRPVHADLSASDVCDPGPAVSLVGVSSSEPDAGPGNHADDVQDDSVGTDDRDLLLRAERLAPAAARVYTTTYTVTDSSGNASVVQPTATVPRSRS